MIIDPCPRERAAKNAYSPGIVEDEEQMVKVLVSPDDWDGQELTPAAFSRKKLRNCELSLVRAKYSTLDIVKEEVVKPQLIRDPKRKVEGCAIARCSEIRGITTSDGERVYCIIDDPVVYMDGKLGAGHALLGFTENTKATGFWARNDRAARILDLTRVFSKGKVPMDLDEVAWCS